MSTEFVDTLGCLCGIIARSLHSYEINKDPCDLDYLIYQVYKFYRILKSVESCTDDVLEKISTSLALFEELQELELPLSVQTSEPQVVVSSSRGRPRFDIRVDQLEYLLDSLAQI